MEGPEDDGGEGNLGRAERRRTPRGRSPILLPLDLVTSTRESESVKERVNGLVFRFGGRSKLSVSFSISTTAEGGSSLKNERQRI